MYNRYIPQSDGTHRRRPTQEQPQPAPQPKNAEPPKHRPEQDAPPVQSHCPPRPAFGITHFLHQILPTDFDIGDLIVVLLLLLISADRQEEQNNALLTMALYLFL